MSDMDRRTYGTAGYNAIMDEVRLAMDPDDPFGCVQGWRFALAHMLYHAEALPAEWEYNHVACEPLSESWEADMIIYHLANGHTSAEDLINVGDVLSRYRSLLGIAGKDY